MDIFRKENDKLVQDIKEANEGLRMERSLTECDDCDGIVGNDHLWTDCEQRYLEMQSQSVVIAYLNCGVLHCFAVRLPRYLRSN